jgi:hypothetical protein
MNAMLEPRIVAARIQSLALALHITPSAADGITTSQGILMATMDASTAREVLRITTNKTVCYIRGRKHPYVLLPALAFWLIQEET